MQRIFRTLFLLIWALWLGGVMFLFFAVSALFGKDRTLGSVAAPVLFLCFEKYRLALACISVLLIALIMLTLSTPPWRWIGICVAFGCVTSLFTSQWLTPRINALHLAGLVNTPEFRHLHGISFAVYLCEAVALLLAGVLLPAAMRDQSKPRSGTVEKTMV